MKDKFIFENIYPLLDGLMKQSLNLGQTSLSEHQFKAFRKMTMDYFAEAKRSLGRGRCGECKSNAKGVVAVDG